MRRLVFLMLFAFLLPVDAQIYKWVGEDGSVQFSDRHRPGAIEVVLPAARPLSTRAYAVAGKSGTDTVADFVVYRRLSIVEPEYGATIRDNQGIVDIVVEVDPQLDTEAGDQVQILLDRKSFDEPSQLLERELQNVDRGRHLVVAQVINERGRRLIRSRPIVFYLHRERVEDLEPALHDRVTKVFTEEAGDALSAAERRRLTYVTRDELMEKCIPEFVGKLDAESRRAFMERFIPKLHRQLGPAEGGRVVRRFMRTVMGRLTPTERFAFTDKLIELVTDYLNPEDGKSIRFAISGEQEQYWHKFVNMIQKHLTSEERARLHYLPNPEQRRVFMESFIRSHLQDLNPKQRRHFISRFVPILAAQLRPEQQQEFMAMLVRTGMDSVPVEEQGELIGGFIQRGVDPVTPEERLRRYVATLSPAERERYYYGNAETSMSPEEREKRYYGSPEGRQTRTDAGAEGEYQPGRSGAAGTGTSMLKPRSAAPGFGASSSVTPSQPARPKLGAGARFSSR